MIRVDVDLGERSYPVLVGEDATEALAEVIPETARRAAIVTQEGVGVHVEPGVRHETFLIPDGEESKTLATVEGLCRSWARWGLHRNDVVIAVGGGLTTDLAGFAASSYHRGVGVVHVATTLLAQVDAAIGGKTGVNLPEGKNLVGAFWQPDAVICDTATLATLPAREWRNGRGEMAKYAFLGVDDLGDLEIDDAVAACVRCKADVVASDEREGGRRMILNYGHTLAHALETATGYTLRHGEAVAIGLVYAAEVAYRLGRIDADRVAEHRRVVADYDLPGVLPAGVEPDVLIDLFSRDKKATEGLTLVLDGPRGVEPVIVGDRTLLREALRATR